MKILSQSFFNFIFYFILFFSAVSIRARQAWPEIDALKQQVSELCRKFPVVGFEEKAMKYKL